MFEGKILVDSPDLASYNIRMHANVFFVICSYIPTSIQRSYWQIRLHRINGVVSSTTSVAYLKTFIPDKLKLHSKELVLGSKLLDSLWCLGKYGTTKNSELVIAC